jgi:hypothetical protein
MEPISTTISRSVEMMKTENSIPIKRESLSVILITSRLR